MSDLLLERAAELAAIDRAIRVARAGHGRHVVIAGPPGTGRTALLERARARAADQGMTVLEAGGEAGEREFPLAVARRLLAPGERYDALLELHARLAAAAPVLVTVDDLHLCDEASLDWLAFVARRLRRSGIALVAGVDVGEKGLIGTLEEAGAHVLRLQPFSERAVATVLRVEFGHAVSAEFARDCHRETGGNPSLVRAVAQSGGLVTRFVERRFAPLPTGVRALAEALVVLRDRPALRDAAALARLGAEDAAVAADALLTAGLLERDALAIGPPLVARALYDAIPPARRALMHGEAARCVAGGGASPVRHLLRSAPAADPRVVTTLRRAAEQSLDRGEPGEAATLLRRAVAEAGADDPAGLLTTLAAAERRLGDPAEIRHLKAAAELGGPQPTALALARLTHGRPARTAGADPAELYAAARVCGSKPQEHDNQDLAYRAATAETAEAATALAVEALESGLDPEGFRYALACATLVRCERITLARAHLERALSHARSHGSVPGLVNAETWLAVAELNAGDLESAVLHATTALGGGRHTRLVSPARAALTLALIERDRVADADPLDDADTPELLYARGRLRLARRDAQGALDDFRAVGDPHLPWRSASALAGAPAALARSEHADAVRFGSPRAIGVALRALAAVGSAAERTQRYRDAVAVLAAGEARLEYAHALCDLGASLRRERARRDAREPLRQALDIAVRCGAAALARRAHEELAASGARPRRLAQSGRDSLTPAELRVAGLAARGLANREIAQTLFVTVKTVETELGHAYAKLGIRSRRDLAAVLGQS